MAVLIGRFRYGLASHNCWWYAAVIMSSLESIGCDWIIRPSKDWAKRTVQILGKSTKKLSEEVTDRFEARWPVVQASKTAQTVGYTTNRDRASSNPPSYSSPSSFPQDSSQWSSGTSGPPPIPPRNPLRDILRSRESYASPTQVRGLQQHHS